MIHVFMPCRFTHVKPTLIPQGDENDASDSAKTESRNDAGRTTRLEDRERLDHGQRGPAHPKVCLACGRVGNWFTECEECSLCAKNLCSYWCRIAHETVCQGRIPYEPQRDRKRRPWPRQDPQSDQGEEEEPNVDASSRTRPDSPNDLGEEEPSEDAPSRT